MSTISYKKWDQLDFSDEDKKAENEDELMAAKRADLSRRITVHNDSMVLLTAWLDKSVAQNSAPPLHAEERSLILDFIAAQYGRVRCAGRPNPAPWTSGRGRRGLAHAWRMPAGLARSWRMYAPAEFCGVHAPPADAGIRASGRTTATAART